MSNTPQARAARFLRWLYSEQTGYIEIVAGRTNPTKPDKIDLIMATRRWCYHDPERPDMLDQAAAYAAELASAYGNVYCGVRLYTADARRTNTRAEKYTKPSRVIFIDDAPAAPPMPYSASIRTSEHSRHAYYKCDRPVTKDDARRAAAALGGDPSGVDLTQLVRIPGSFNTKRGERWPVTVEPGDRPVYSLDRVRAVFPAVAPARAKGEITDLAWPTVEKHLANIGALLGSARANTIKPDTQSGRILAGELLTFSVRNRQDDSRSMNAFVLGNGFYLRGFPDEEIAAVMFHKYREWGVERDKGTAWCKDDICRSIAQMHAKKPGMKQSPTRYLASAAAAPLVEQPAASRARHDRPRQLDPLMLFNRYRQQPALCELSRKPRAAALGISTATLDRLDAALREWEMIEIETLPKRAGSRVLLRVGVINIPSDGVLSAPQAASADCGAAIAENDDRAPQCIGETHPPPETPQPPAAPAAPCSLADAVRLAILAMEQEAVNPETGEVWRGRANPDRVRGWLATYYPGLDTTAIEAEYPAVRKALQVERQRAKAKAFWDSERARIRALSDAQLLAALWGCASRKKAAERKRPDSPWARRCAWLFTMHDDERRRRGLAIGDAPPPAKDRASRKAATARMKQLATVVNAPPVHSEDSTPAQLGFATVVEDTTWMRPIEPPHERKTRTPQPRKAARHAPPAAAGAGTRGGVCSPQPAPQAPQPSRGKSLRRPARGW